MYEDYYTEREEYRVSKHSGFGIASFVIALVVGVLEFVLIVAAGILESTTPGGIDENSPIAIVLGLVMIGGFLLDLLAIIFGIVGLCQHNRSKIFAILGLVIGCLVVAGCLLLIVAGLAMG